MKLKLEFQPSLPNKKLNFYSNFFFIGSCFAEHISSKFSNHYLNTFLNPNGIVYNPLSISEQIKNCILKKKYFDEDVFFHDDQWHCFDFHSSFSSNNKNNFLQIINHRVNSCFEKLKETDFLFITFGSAYVYNHNNKLVGNCHKLPSSSFKKKLLTKEEIVNSYTKLIHLLKELNPKLQIVFSISPVRYIRDGIIENNLSKAILIQSVHEIISNFNNCQYFPAYEIVIDELRDYRFFKDDFVHPNEIAINFVWEKLKYWMDNETISILDEITRFNKFKNHTPINSAKAEQHKFEIDLKIEILKKKYPLLKIS